MASAAPILMSPCPVTTPIHSEHVPHASHHINLVGTVSLSSCKGPQEAGVSQHLYCGMTRP